MEKKQYVSFLKFMWKFLRNEKALVMLIIVSIFFHAIFSIGLPIIIQTLIDNILTVYEKGYFLWIILAMVLVPSISGALMVIEDYSGNKLGHKVLTEMRVRLFSKHLKREFSSQNKTSSGEKIQTIIDEPDEIGHWIYITSIQILLNFLCIILILGMLFYLDFGLGALAFVLLFLYTIPFIKYQKAIQQVSYQELKWRGVSTGILNEGLNAVPLYKSFGKTSFLQRRFEKANDVQLGMFLKAIGLDRKSNTFIGIVMAIGVSLIYLYGGLKVIEGQLSIGGIIAAKMYIETLFLRSQVLYNRVIETNTKIPIATKLEQEDTYHDSLDEKKKKEIDSVNSIAFKGTSLKFDSKLVFQDLNLDIPIGKYTVIEGESGSGKTSLLKLLFGIMHPDKGEVLINNLSVKDLDIMKLRNKIQYVPQNPEFMDISIYDNLTFGMEDSKETSYIEYLLDKFNINDFVQRLPNGYKTIIGNHHGVKLSGGQLRRLALVRALIQKPEVILLDEANSGIDSKNSAMFQDSLKEIEGLTVVSASHNIDEISQADNVFNIFEFITLNNKHENVVLNK